MSSLPEAVEPRTGPLVRPALPGDREALVALLGACSAETLHHRFLTGFGGAPRPSLVARLLARDGVARAVLALVDGEVVGHGMCARAAPRTVELALLVRDDHHRRGIGTALVAALRQEARTLGAAEVQLTTGADNRAVLAMVAARASGLRPVQDGTTLTYRLALPSTVPPTVRPSPRINPEGASRAGCRPGSRLSASGRS